MGRADVAIAESVSKRAPTSGGGSFSRRVSAMAARSSSAAAGARVGAIARASFGSKKKLCPVDATAKPETRKTNPAAVSAKAVLMAAVPRLSPAQDNHILLSQGVHDPE